MVWDESSTFTSFLFLFPIAEQAAKNGEDDYRGDSKFASHLKTATAASTFARTRTLKEQREYLPAFACREDLMKMLRDFQGLCSFPRKFGILLIVS